MDFNLEDLPFVVYACFVLHNVCEMNNERIEEHVTGAVDYDKIQPSVVSNIYRTDSNEAEGKKVRKLITKFFENELHN